MNIRAESHAFSKDERTARSTREKRERAQVPFSHLSGPYHFTSNKFHSCVSKKLPK